MECNVEKLQELEKLSKLEFGSEFKSEFVWGLKLPKESSQQVIQVLDCIERLGCKLFQDPDRYTEDIEDRDVADYLLQKGFKIFNRISNTFLI